MADTLATIRTSRDPPVTAGTSWNNAPYERDDGSELMTSPVTVKSAVIDMVVKQ